jgi:hypothetical protein
MSCSNFATICLLSMFYNIFFFVTYSKGKKLECLSLSGFTDICEVSNLSYEWDTVVSQFGRLRSYLKILEKPGKKCTNTLAYLWTSSVTNKKFCSIETVEERCHDAADKPN